MSRKRSQAVIMSVRLNPINEHEKKVIETVKYWEGQGYNFKQLVVDRILRVEGFTPEMFDRDSRRAVDISGIGEALSPLLERFAQEIIDSLMQAGVSGKATSVADEADSVSASAFTKRFMAGIKERQQQGQGDND